MAARIKSTKPLGISLILTVMVFAGFSGTLGYEGTGDDNSDDYMVYNGFTGWSAGNEEIFVDKQWNIAHKVVNFTKFLENVSSNMAASLPINDHRNIHLNLTLAPWDSDIILHNEEGHVTPIEGLTRLLQANETTHASFVAYNQGMSGTVYTNTTIIDYTSQGLTPEGDLMLTIAERENPTGTIPPPMNQAVIDCDEPDFSEPEVGEIFRRFCHTAVDTIDGVLGSFVLAPGYPYNPPTPPRERVLSGDFHMDASFRDEVGDAFIHVATAMNHQRNMWADYTGNRVGSGAFWSPQDLNAGNGCADLLVAFTASNNNGLNRDNADYFVLVSGQQVITDLLGCTRVSSLGPGFLGPDRDTVNYGLNIPSMADYRGGTSSTHLGLLIAHELGHLWGEPIHRCDRAHGEFSIMGGGDCSGMSFNSMRFWMHYGDTLWDCDHTMERVIVATHQYDGGSGGCSGGRPPPLIQLD